MLFELSSSHWVIRFAIAFEQLGNETFERAAVFPRATSVAPFISDVPIAQPVQKQPFRFVGQVFPRRFQKAAFFEIKVGLNGASHAFIDMPSPASDAFDRSQQSQATVPQRFLLVLDQRLQDELKPLAEAVALMTHSLRAVKAEELRRRRFETDSAIGAGVMRTEKLFGSRTWNFVTRFCLPPFAFFLHNQQAAFAEF